MPMSAALAGALLSFIVGAGTVLSVIGTHLYAVDPGELPGMLAR
jgi:hypothetical protein